jgi:glycosyltransferase involved in cell wall biosynthesis
MRRPVLHQFIVGAAPGDAITDQALLLNRWLREDGFNSLIFAESIEPALTRRVRSYMQYRPSRPGETVILHHSIGTAMVDYLLSLDVWFLIVYHNVTPPEFLRNADPALAEQLARGRKQLTPLRDRTLLGLAASPYNEAELKRIGFAPTGVLPNMLDESQYRLDSNPDLLAHYRGKEPLLLFVGRLAPNKRQEDLIKLLHYYRRIEPSAHLLLVGTPWVPTYANWLQEMAQELGLGEAVVFAGHVSQRDMVTYYRLADLYVSMSEHEGFGKPLIESMYLGLPVLAYARAAVPGTMGGSGVLFREKRHEALAELVDILVKDDALRQRIIARQRERAKAFLEPEVHRTWRAFLREASDANCGSAIPTQRDDHPA